LAVAKAKNRRSQPMPDGPKVSPNNGFELGVALALSADSRAQNDGGVSSIAVRQNRYAFGDRAPNDPTYNSGAVALRK
jgi:hypothetical protein